MTNRMTATVAQVESILRATCADLHGLPLYIATATEYPEIAGWIGPCSGAYQSGLDLGLSEELQKRGLWEGRGPAIFVNDCEIREQTTADDFLPMIIGVCVHELCHWLSCPKWWDEKSRDLCTRPLTDSLAFLLRLRPLRLPEIEERIEARELPPWHNHEADFVRVCCHLRERLPSDELRRAFDELYAGDNYGLSSPYRYSSALRSELTKRYGESIRDILQSEPPESFRDLWHSDTASRARGAHHTSRCLAD